MFAIGDKEWPGISKLVEECGEVLQVCGKLFAVRGEAKHWDGSNLHEKLVDELADLSAAIGFVVGMNRDKLNQDVFAARAKMKLARFEDWHKLGLEATLKLRDVKCPWCTLPDKHDGECHGDGAR